MESPHTLIRAPEREEVPPPPGGGRLVGPPAAARGSHARERLLLDRYRLIERLGAGGFGEVWRARDETLGREVALKRIWFGAAADGRDERAMREAHASARLSHPAIVGLYEAVAADDALYLVSELVQGRTLASLLAAGELDDEEILEIGLAVSAALAHAHQRGVVHRDVKPHNILVPDEPPDPARAAKLTDFGGATLAGEDALTRTGDVLGTLAYMAPEQIEGGLAAEAADLYSLALVLYEALAGENPVRGATPAATARRIGRPLPPLGRRRRDLPSELARAIDRALAPQPRARGTIDDLAVALRHGLQAPRGPSPGRLRRAAGGHGERHTGPRSGGAAAPHARSWPAQARGEDTHDPPRSGPPVPAPGYAGGFTATRLARATSGSRALPRWLWLAAAASVLAWQLAAGRPGLALLLAVALAPIALLPAAAGWSWLLAAIAPALGAIAVAGAFPAIAGQARRLRQRAMAGALGYWWLTLAEPLLGRRLWLGQPAGARPRGAWEGSLHAAAVHVVGPLLAVGPLLGALLWAAAAAALPWIVRGASAAVDIVAASAWSAAVVSAAPALDAGLPAHGAPAEPRGAVLGAVLGGLLAVAARALRGPVGPAGA